MEVVSKTDKYTKVRPIEDVLIEIANSWIPFLDVIDGKAFLKKWLLPEKRKTFWIENEYIEAVKGKKEYIFKSRLPHLYLTDPERELKNRSKGRTYEDELAKNVTIDIRQCKEKVSYENAEWIYVKSHYYKGGKTIYNQGWVKVPEETERFSAYNWKKFGFKTYDAEAHRMYPIKGVNSYEGTSEFIKKMIRLIDGQGKDNKKDGKIQNEELQACYNKPELYHTFSRMVCKHKSEWSYKWEKIEKDARAFYKYHYSDAKEKEIKERLDEVKLKYDALYDFWAVLKAKGVFKTDTFWYFEPFGWVEQMKRVFSSKWHDPVDNPMCTIFTQSQVSGEFNENGKHWGLFGKTRGDSEHHGLDFFAVPGTPVYACVECEVQKIVTDEKVPKGYGKQIFLKVLDKTTFIEHYIEYNKLYPDMEYDKLGDFSKDRDIILQYAHLRKIYVKEGWIIKKLDIPIGETGVSGVVKNKTPDGTCAPHLHFEIRNPRKERINPGFFIKFKDFNTMNEEEKKLQQDTAKAGKIYEFEGLKDIYKEKKDYE